MARNLNRSLILIIILAAAIRLISLNQTLWLDEAINVLAARDRQLRDLLGSYTLGDFHPPLYHLLLWVWLRLLPATEVAARLPSLIFGVASVFLVYRIGKEMENEKTKTAKRVGALLLATSGLHVYYSQEARMYALAAATTTLTIWLLLLLKTRSTLRLKIFYMVSVVLMLLSDYQPWLLLPWLFFLRPGLTSFATLMTLPWWPFLIRQLEQGIQTAREFPLWRDVVGGLSLKAMLLVPIKFLVGRVSIDNDLIFAAVLSLPLALVSLALFSATKNRSNPTKVLLGWLALPLLISFFISLRLPIFSYFRFLFLLPAFYLLIAFGAASLSPTLRKVVLTTLLLTNLVSTSAYLLIPRFHRENWRGVANLVHQYDASQTLVLFPNKAQAAAFDYYDAGRTTTQDLASLSLTQDFTHVFLVRYVSEIFDPKELLVGELGRVGYTKVEEIPFRGIPLWHYVREEGGL